MKNGKAPGPDGFTYEIIKQFYNLIPKFFLELYNCCWRLQCIPYNWKRAEIVLLSKKDKNQESANAFRPICLINCIGKIFEKVIYHRIQYHIYNRNLLSPNQHGFSPGKSPITALKSITEFIQDSKKNDKYSILISLDIVNAFNSLWWPAVLHQLQKLEIASNIFNLLANYFNNRTIFIEYNNIYLERTLQRGCPQGSCLGPVLWNIAMDSIFSIQIPQHSKLQAFADDIALVISATSRSQLISDSKCILNSLQLWAYENKLKFDSTKTKGLLINGIKKKLRTNPSISTDNIKVKMSKNLKYLGIIFDNRLSWKDHIEYLSIKTKNQSQSLRKLCSRTGGLKGFLIKRIYQTCIEKSISYGCSIWYNQLNCKLRSKLDALQRNSLILITKAYRSVSTHALQIIAGCAPTHIMLEKTKKETNLLQLHIPTLIGNILFQPTDFESKRNIYSTHPADWTGLQWKSWTIVDVEKHLKDTCIYTDGSCGSNGVGAAFVVTKYGTILSKHSFRLNNNNSIFQAESEAISQSINWIINYNCQDNNFIITDSKQVLLALENGACQNEKIFSIQRRILSVIKNGGNIQLIWIKSHSNIPGNDTADQLAKEVIKSTNSEDSSTPIIEISLPISRLKFLTKEESINSWTTLWNSSTKGRFTFGLGLLPSFHLTSQDHWTTQAITGHSQCPELLNKLNLSNTNQCRCGQIGSTLHYIYDCSTTETLRKKCVKTFPRTIDILKHLKDKAIFSTIKEILDFMENNINSYITPT